MLTIQGANSHVCAESSTEYYRFSNLLLQLSFDVAGNLVLGFSFQD